MIEARDSSVDRKKKYDSCPEERGDRRRNLTGQEADSWDVTEYVPYCHLGEALSKVTNVSYIDTTSVFHDTFVVFCYRKISDGCGGQFFSAL